MYESMKYILKDANEHNYAVMAVNSVNMERVPSSVPLLKSIRRSSSISVSAR